MEMIRYNRLHATLVSALARPIMNSLYKITRTLNRVIEGIPNETG